MTEIQIKFLECIYEGDKNAEELCKLLKIKGYENDELAGFYNALNNSINYLTTDDGNEIDNMFSIRYDKNSPVSNKDIYVITKEGRQYVENYRNDKKNRKQGNWTNIISIIIGIIGVVVAIISAIL